VGKFCDFRLKSPSITETRVGFCASLSTFLPQSVAVASRL